MEVIKAKLSAKGVALTDELTPYVLAPQGYPFDCFHVTSPGYPGSTRIRFLGLSLIHI